MDATIGPEAKRGRWFGAVAAVPCRRAPDGCMYALGLHLMLILRKDEDGLASDCFPLLLNSMSCTQRLTRFALVADIEPHKAVSA